MAVVVTADVAGQTQEGYEASVTSLEEGLRGAPGFICHFSHPIEGGWRVIEVWESSKEAAEWFAKAVRPFLPPDIKPNRHVEELHTLIR